MSAAELRKTAETLRRRAQKSAIESPGPWKSLHHGVQADDGRWVCDVASTLGKYELEASNRHYIARMHPGVGLALADHLDAFADLLDSFGPQVADRITPDDTLLLARLINGGTS